MQNLLGEFPLKAVWAKRGLFARFNQEGERYFKGYHQQELLTRARGASMAAAVVMVIYSVLDWLMIPPEILGSFLAIRYAFVITPMLIVFWVSYQPWAVRYLQRINCCAAVSSGMAIIALLCIARANGTPIAYEGIILTVFYFYCCGGLTLFTAFVSGMLVMLVYPLAEYHYGLAPEEVVIRSVFLWSANAVGIISSAIMEQSARRNFALATELKNQASRDYLTSLLNRRALRDRLDSVWGNAVREKTSISMAMIDIDYFKRYNDQQGHAMGDEALRKVAHVLQQHARRPLDLAARYGGEEFLCVWSGNTAQQMGYVLQGIEDDVRAVNIPHGGSPHRRVSISVGCVHLYPTEDTNIKETMTLADELLYQAKAEGRNRVVLQSLTASGGDGLEFRSLGV